MVCICQSMRRNGVIAGHLHVIGIAQSFVDTHIEHSPQEPTKRNPIEMQPDFCCPCGGFLGWKQIRLGGKSLSRSYSDLRSLGNLHARGWAWDTPDVTPPSKPLPVEEQKLQVPEVKEVEVEQKPPAGTSALERLPPEVLGKCWIFTWISGR